MADRWLFFDFDGVIADSESISLRSWRALARDPDAICLQDICGNSAHYNATKLAHLLVHDGTIEQIVATKVALDEAHVAKFGIDLVGSVAEVLAGLAETYSLAVVSSSTADRIVRILVEHDLERHFLFISCPRPDRRVKPAPDLYLAALDIASVTPDQAVAIEDSASGWKSATDAGLPVVGFGEGLKGANGLAGWLPSFVDIDECSAVIAGSFFRWHAA